MTGSIQLLVTEHPRRRALEDLLADRRPLLRDLPVVDERDGETLRPWPDTPPDLLVISAFGRTADAVAVVRAALMAEPDLSVLIADEPEAWPETLRLLPGVAVDDLQSRSVSRAVLARLLERRALLRAAAVRAAEAPDRLAAVALQSEVPAARETALLMRRLVERKAHVVLAGEPGTLRQRILREVAREAGLGPFGAVAASVPGTVSDDGAALLVDDIDGLSPLRQGEVLRLARQGRRVLATASLEFQQRIQDGSFRSDLYYALGGQPVTCVALRERRADLPALVGATGTGLADEHVLQVLAGYAWPGNLRELELVLEHARLIADGEPVGVGHLVLPEEFVRSMLADAFVLRIPQTGVSLDEVERELLRQTLAATDRNVTEAARRLAVGREKLRYRMKRLGLGR